MLSKTFLFFALERRLYLFFDGNTVRQKWKYKIHLNHYVCCIQLFRFNGTSDKILRAFNTEIHLVDQEIQLLGWMLNGESMVQIIEIIRWGLVYMSHRLLGGLKAVNFESIIFSSIINMCKRCEERICKLISDSNVWFFARWRQLTFCIDR